MQGRNSRRVRVVWDLRASHGATRIPEPVFREYLASATAIGAQRRHAKSPVAVFVAANNTTAVVVAFSVLGAAFFYL